MATKSFLKNINISGKKNVRQFLHAINKVENYNGGRCGENPSSYIVLGDNIDTLLSGYTPRDENR